VTIVYKNNGAWGTGKGSPLTSLEADGNTWDHEERIEELETNPTLPTSIANITVVGSQMSVVLTDATVLGPYTIPRVPFQPSRVESLTGTSYDLVIGDVNTYKRCTNNSDVTVTVPAHADVAFDVDTEITFRQCGSGTVTIMAGETFILINGVDGFENSTAAQGAVMTLKNVDEDVWDLFGLLMETP